MTITIRKQHYWSCKAQVQQYGNAPFPFPQKIWVNFIIQWINTQTISGTPPQNNSISIQEYLTYNDKQTTKIYGQKYPFTSWIIQATFLLQEHLSIRDEPSTSSWQHKKLQKCSLSNYWLYYTANRNTLFMPKKNYNGSMPPTSQMITLNML